MMTKIFPHEFDRSCKKFNVRFVPNIINDNIVGDSIVVAYKNSKSLIKRKSLIYFSYAIVSPFDSFNSYLHDNISIVRYGKYTFDDLFFYQDKMPFDLNSEVSFIFREKKERGMTFFEIDNMIESKNNKLYDEFHPGKNDKDSIIKFLKKRDKHIELLALQLSDDEYKPDIKEVYKDVIRDHKISQLI